MDKIRLQYEMRAKGVTAKELCKAIGISLCAFSRKCNGKSQFTLKEIKAITKYLELDSPIPIFFADFVS